MVKMLAGKLWSMRKEFAKYFIIGISAFFADVGSLFFLKEFFRLSPTLAVVINQPIIVLGVFFLNKHWSFKAGGITHRQMVKFCILAVFNYSISVGWIYIFHDKFGVYYLYARTMNIALSVAWNFLLYKYWVYRIDQSTPVGHAGLT